MSDAVRITSEGGLTRITLARPEKRNALSFELVGALNEALGAAAADETVRVVLLDAEGKAFCAGMDLKTVPLDDPDQAAEFAKQLGLAYKLLMTLPVPLLCAVDGPAMGGAVGLALAADLVWIGADGKFAFPETRVGIVPALVSVPARRRMMSGKLAGMLLTGLPAEGQKAVDLGLADFYVEGDALPEARAFGEKLIRENSDEAMRRTKAFVRGQFADSLNRELNDAIKEFNLAVSTPAAARGLDSFRNKTPLIWNEPAGGQ